MKKRVISMVIALVLSIVALAGFAETVNASEYSHVPDGCYEELRPFGYGKADGD